MQFLFVPYRGFAKHQAYVQDAQAAHFQEVG